MPGQKLVVPALCRAELGTKSRPSALWKSYFELLRDHFGQCAVEGLLWATQSYWDYSRITLALFRLASVLWKGYFRLSGLLRDHFGQCAVEGLLRDHFGYSRTTVGSVLWKSYFGLLKDHSGGCGRATLGYSGTTLASVLWKGYFGLLRATQGPRAVGPFWPVCCGRATMGYFGLLRDHFGQCAVEELSWATGRTEVQSSKNLTTPQSYGWGMNKQSKTKLFGWTYKAQTSRSSFLIILLIVFAPVYIWLWLWHCFSLSFCTLSHLNIKKTEKMHCQARASPPTSLQWVLYFSEPTPCSECQTTRDHPQDPPWAKKMCQKLWARHVELDVLCRL